MEKKCPKGKEWHGGREWNSPYHKLMDAYVCVGRLHRLILERELNQKTGVYRGQHQLLMFIADHPNISQKELAKLSHITSATVAVSLKKLEQGGYVRRAVDKEDNRFNQICITEKGRRVVANSICFFQSTEKRMFAGFSSEETEQLCGYLGRIHGNLVQYAEELSLSDLVSKDSCVEHNKTESEE